MFLRKYATGTGADVCIPIIKRGVVDFALGADWTPATGDVKVSLDGGTAANIATLPVAIAMGNGAVWKFVFSNAELTCKSIVVTVSDSATKAVEDQAFIVETYGNASAMYVVDYSTAAFGANTTAPDNASITLILEDTSELQTNQGNWLTATGFSTHSAADVWAVGTRSLTTFGSLVSDVATAVWAAGTRTLTAISDSSGITTLLTRITALLETKAEADTRQTVILTAIDAIEGGGGGAGADEIVDELLDRGITAIPVQSGVTSAGNLDLVQGDTYNGTAKPLLSFPTSTDYTSGWTATLTIRDVDDEVIATASGVVASATQVTVSLTTPTGLTFDGCPGIWQGKFDVQMSKDTQRATIAHGTAYVRAVGGCFAVD